MDNSYGAREIINGDKHIVPSGRGGVSIGNLIKGYHIDFLAALEASLMAPAAEAVVIVQVTAPAGIEVQLVVNGRPVS